LVIFGIRSAFRRTGDVPLIDSYPIFIGLDRCLFCHSANDWNGHIRDAWRISASQIQFHTIGGPGRNPGAKEVRILSPHRATDRHGARYDRPIIGIA
jgi:hypothetical protein